MRITQRDGGTYSLHAETPADQAFIDALDLHRAAFVEATTRKPHRDVPRAFENESAIVEVRRVRMPDLAGQAVSQALGGIGNIQGLGLGQPALDGPVGANATDPQPQEALASHLQQLKVVALALGVVIGQAESVLKEMRSTHDGSSSETHIVAQGGAA